MAIGHTLYGQGPEKVVVMHGWFSDHTAYDTLQRWLDPDRFTFAFMDFRGYGQSKAIDGAHTIPEMGQDAFDLAESLGWERFHAVGHSMAGKAVQWMARERPERLKSIVGLTPVPAIAIPMEPDAMGLFSTAWENQDNRATIIGMTTGDRLGDLWARTLAEGSRAQSTPDAFRDYFHAWQGEDHSAGMQNLKTPFLAVVGRHDAAITPETMEGTTLTWFDTAEMEIFEDAGHYPMLEAPPHLAKTVQDFLSKHA